MYVLNVIDAPLRADVPSNSLRQVHLTLGVSDRSVRVPTALPYMESGRGCILCLRSTRAVLTLASLQTRTAAASITITCKTGRRSPLAAMALLRQEISLAPL